MAAPKTINSEIIAMLNALAISREELSDFEKARFKRDLEALQRKDHANGLMVFGSFYALTGEPKKAISFHEKSLLAGGHQAVFYKNYAVSLRYLGYLDRGLIIDLEGLKRDPGDKLTLLKASESVVCAGHIIEFEAALDRYIKATQDESIMEENNILLTKEVSQYLKDLNITEKEFNHAYLKVEAVCRQFDIKASGYGVTKLVAEEHEYLNLEIRCNVGGRLLAQMNNDLVEAMAEDLDFCPWNKIIHTFTYSNIAPGAHEASVA